MFQNMVQLLMINNDKDMRTDAYSEFIKSLKQTDKDFVKRMLKEFEENDYDITRTKVENE